MVYAVILSAGKGTRMGLTELPKQFLYICNKPLVVHTIEKFILSKKVDKVLLVVRDEWVSHSNDIIEKYIPSLIKDKVIVCKGGNDRNESVSNSISFIEKNFGINSDDIIVTHDAVRPFVSSRIINDNVEMAKIYGATDTVVKACDTIVESTNSNIITSIPNRDYMYLGQTPQSFNLLKLKNLLSELTEEEASILTDCAKIFVLKGEDVKLVDGEYSNIKITNPFDFKVASMLLNEEVLNDK